MTDQLSTCVPIATDDLSADLRVNYQFGLVLGVDEFLQEDLYFRERDERGARSLHGYGTVSGLAVTAERPAAAPADVEVRVEPGIGLDQFGRPVVVRSTQCARIGAWIAAELAAADEAGSASPLDEHRRPSGDVTVYVVAEYATCLDGLVPLPGRPCGSDDEITAPSRIRDAWSLGFRWAPPAMERWDATRDLADLLLRVDVHDVSPVQTDEPALAEHIRAMAPGAPAPTIALPATPVLPRREARAALDRLLTVWITEVRPHLSRDLIEPDGDPAILLSAVTVVPANPFDGTAPVIDSFAAPDDDGRPYLAPTQLLQELSLLGSGGDTVVIGSPIQPQVATTTVELASLTDITTSAARRLVLWSELGDMQLVPPPEVRGRRNGAAAPIRFAVGAGPTADTWELTAQSGGALRDGELVEIDLDVTAVQVRRRAGGPTIPVADWLDRNHLVALGAEAGTVVLRHVMAPAPSAPQQPPPPRPVHTLLTATPMFVDNTVPTIELWWHVDKAVFVDDERVKEIDPATIKVWAEVEVGSTPVELRFDLVTTQQHNVFELRLDRDEWRSLARTSPYLRVMVELGGIGTANGRSLQEWADDLGVAWLDAQEDGRLLAAWVRMPPVRG